jgi:hypothetical protein
MRAIRRRVLPATAVGVALLAAACVPSEKGALREVDEGPGSRTAEATAPEFPDVGNVAPDLVVEGLTFDLTQRPRDQNYWAPHHDEATCASEAIVEALGHDRLVGLGYRPGVAGASLNDVDLSEGERAAVVDAVEGCVDLVEGFAAVLYGNGRMAPRIAACVARGMGGSGQLGAVAEAWVSGRAIDPFAEGSDFAAALLGHAEVCIPAQAFNWPDVHLPDDERLIDADLPAGSTRSAYVDDAEDLTEPTAAPTATTSTTTP